MKISQEIEKKINWSVVCFFARKIVEEFQNLEIEFSKKKKRVKSVIFSKNIWRKERS